MDDQLRVDGEQAFAHRLGFVAADVGAECLDLTVGVGDAHVVEIDECQRADAGARQRFRCPGADTADADHAGMTAAQLFCLREAVQALNTAETLWVVAGHGERRVCGLARESTAVRRIALRQAQGERDLYSGE